MSTARFYDDLADSYHALYPDWGRSIARQAGALDRLLSRSRPGPADIIDVSCGIGTQLIGLGALGHRVIGSDLSAGAVRRAWRECAAAGVRARLLTADMRSLPLAGACADAVVCADNAVPHLLTDEDVTAALTEMRRVLRPGGTVIVTTRDYDRILADPPASTLPQVYESAGERVISFQLWNWRENSDIYGLEHFQVHERGDGTRDTERRTATYRAWTRAALTGLASAARLQDVRWHMPAESGFFQPAMTARRQDLRGPGLTDGRTYGRQGLQDGTGYERQSRTAAVTNGGTHERRHSRTAALTDGAANGRRG